MQKIVPPNPLNLVCPSTGCFLCVARPGNRISEMTDQDPQHQIAGIARGIRRDLVARKDNLSLCLKKRTRTLNLIVGGTDNTDLRVSEAAEVGNAAAYQAFAFPGTNSEDVWQMGMYGCKNVAGNLLTLINSCRSEDTRYYTRCLMPRNDRYQTVNSVPRQR